MKLLRWKDIKSAGMRPERIARSDARVARAALAIRLRALRQAAGMTQVQLARAASLTQSQLSRLEQNPNLELRTLDRYARAAGARVEISAFIGAKEIPLAVMGMPEGRNIANRKRQAALIPGKKGAASKERRG
jgi:transcriptional regulator with XRE-family HTH domain